MFAIAHTSTACNAACNTFVMPPMMPANTESAGSQHRPILAERFRTKLCRNHVERGTCPYVHRCMFAHGEFEMRTTAQNVADRLFSEDAIRAFKRYHYELTKARLAANASFVAAPACSEIYCKPAGTTTPMPESVASAASSSPRVRRHDPYAAKSEWHPLGRSTVSVSSHSSSCDGV
jgi:hypothetical protein